MEKDHHSEIMRAIGNLEGKIDGIISRQDISNGRTGKNEDAITILQNWRSGIVAVIALAAFVIPLILAGAHK